MQASINKQNETINKLKRNLEVNNNEMEKRIESNIMQKYNIDMQALAEERMTNEEQKINEIEQRRRSSPS